MLPAKPRPAHLWKKGTSGNPAGRPPGAKDKRTRMWQAAQEISLRYRISPLEYMVSIVNDPRHYPKVRLEAAKAAAPYLHARLPLRIETDGAEQAMVEAADLEHLTDEELALVGPILLRLAGMASKQDATDLDSRNVEADGDAD